MEYRKSSDTEWTDIPTNGLSFEPQTIAIKYYIRIKAGSDYWASSNRSLTMVAKTTAPKCIYNEETETITGLSTLMEISFNGGRYDAILSGTTYSLSYLIDNIPVDGNLIVKIRIRATATAPASLEQVFTIYARPVLEQVLTEVPELPTDPETPMLS